jgi:hypothetical protein
VREPKPIMLLSGRSLEHLVMHVGLEKICLVFFTLLGLILISEIRVKVPCKELFIWGELESDHFF